MPKYLFQIATAMCIALILLTGCVENTADNAGNNAQNAIIDSGTGNENVIDEKCVLTPPKEPVPCTMQYDPVCGCDGKTYGNACMARGAGVPRSTPGACDENPNL